MRIDHDGTYLRSDQEPWEPMFAMRCVACDGPITGYAYIPVVAKYHEYCPRCEYAISCAKAAERRQMGVQGESD